MYRVIAITAAGLVLAACSSDTSIKNLFAFEPAKDTIRFESEPAGADAKTSTGQACRTPCALAMPADKAFTVAFTLAGYQPTNEEVKLTAMGDGSSQLRPNPVLVELTPAPPPKPKKKVRRKRTAAKPTPKPKPKPVAATPTPAAPPAPPPMTPAPQPQATSPWPSAPPPQLH
jgi:hypothetical protein